MTIQTWDPNRVGGGTIELIQDPTTGVFTTNEVGFVKLPDLSLPEITQAAYDDTPDDGDPDDDTADPCPDGYKLVDGTCQPTGTSSGGGGGGGSGGGDYTLPVNQPTTGPWDVGEWGPGPKSSTTGPWENRTWGPQPKGGEDVHDMDAYATLPGRRVDTHDFEGVDFNKQAQAYPNIHAGEGEPVKHFASEAIRQYHNREQRIKNIQGHPKASPHAKNIAISKILAERPTPPTFDRFSDLETEVKNYPRQESTFRGLDDPISHGIAPQFGGTTLEDEFTSTPRPVPFGTPTDRRQGFMEDKVVKPLTGVKEVGKNLINKKFTDTLKADAKELAEKGKKTLKIVPVTVRLMSGALDALFGVTDADRMRQTTNKSALTSLGYKTVGEVTGSGAHGSGRVAGNPMKNVFAGMNLVSAKGDIMQGARNRVGRITNSIGKNRTKADAARKAGKIERANKIEATIKRQETLKGTFQKQINVAQARKNKQTMNLGRPGRDDGSGAPGCFIKGTLVTMLNGSTKAIEKVDLGDNVAKGGKVFAVGRFLINNLYDYKGIKVSGSHMVNEDDKWIRIEDSKHGKALGNDEHTVYVFGSENRRILINDILFTDYFEVTDQEKLLKYEDKFFDNWRSYSKNEDINNVNTLNAS